MTPRNGEGTQSGSRRTRFGPSSIRGQLLLLVVAVALPLAILGAGSIWVEFREDRRQAEDLALALAEGTASNIRRFLDDTRTLLEVLAEGAGREALTGGRCPAWFGEANALLPHYTNLAVVDSGGRAVCSALGAPATEPDSPVGSGWFERVRRSGRFTVGAPQRGELSGHWVSVLALPIRSREGATLGAVALPVDLVRFQQVLAGTRLPGEALVTLQSADRTVLARSSDADRWVGRQLPEAPPGRDQARGVSRARGLDGLDRLWGYVDLPEARWRVYAGLPLRSIDGPVLAEAAQNVGLGVAILLLVSLLAASLHRRISGSLSALVEGVREAALGGGPVSRTGPREVVEVVDQVNLTLRARDRAEAEVRQAEARYRAVMRNAAFGILLADADGRLLEANPALVGILGFPGMPELLRRPLVSFFDDATEADAVLDRFRRSGAGYGCEVAWRTADDVPRTIRLAGTTFADAEGAPVLELIVEDVTERRRLEENLRQSQKMQAIGRLAGGVAHDFNNLLTVINGQAMLALEDLPDDEPARGMVEEILSSGTRAAKLTRQLLSVGRRDVVQPRVLDLNTVTRGLRSTLQRLVGDGVVLSFHLSEEPAPVEADPGQIEQVLMNLVLNGRDALREGGRLRISTEVTRGRTREGGGSPGIAEVTLIVEDDGTGMDAATRSRAFEPFFTTKPDGEGTGLGLATVYGIVSGSGGHITVDTSPGKGTTVRVHLPKADAAGGPEAAEESLAGPGRAGNGTILLAEDDPSVRRMVSRILGRAGYEVLAVENGREALVLAEWREGPIDLLLTDVMMPVMNGPDLVERLARVRPEIPVLYMSGYAEDELVERTLQGGTGGFLAKPFSPETLLLRVHELLEEVRAGRPDTAHPSPHGREPARKAGRPRSRG